MFGKPAPEASIDMDTFLPPAPKDANDEETASWWVQGLGFQTLVGL